VGQPFFAFFSYFFAVFFGFWLFLFDFSGLLLLFNAFCVDEIAI